MKLDSAVLDPHDLSTWSISDLAAQLISVSVGHHDNQETPADLRDTVDNIAALVQQYPIGGVCYFSGSFAGENPAVAREAIARLQAQAQLPLLISIDQEGGLVTRVREPATRIASAMALAAVDDPAVVRRLGEISAQEMLDVGVNHVFAPDADVNTEPRNPVIGIRSAGADVSKVSQFVVDALESLQSEGVAACIKHFPGHGNTEVDSHLGMPTLDLDYDSWKQGEAVPFIAGIAAGVDSVMVGHLAAPGLDPEGGPASLSKAIVTGLLRDDLGFGGLIVTDALDMGGAQIEGGSGEICVRALEAGVDQLLMPFDPRTSIDAIVSAVESGRLTRQRLEESVVRTVALKEKVRLRQSLPQGQYAVHQQFATKAQRDALAWRDVSWQLTGDQLVLVLDKQRDPTSRGFADIQAELEDAFAVAGKNVEVFALQDWNPALVKQRPVVVVTRDAWRDHCDAEALRSAARDAQCVVAARSPYDSALVPAQVPVLLSFGDIPGVGLAIADALVGGAVTGKLPIVLPQPQDEN